MSTLDDFPIVDSVAGISNEQLNAYIQGAENGYDITTLKRIPNPFFQKLHLIPSDLAETVNERAREEHVSAEQVIRKALENYLQPARVWECESGFWRA